MAAPVRVSEGHAPQLHQRQPQRFVDGRLEVTIDVCQASPQTSPTLAPWLLPDILEVPSSTFSVPKFGCIVDVKHAGERIQAKSRVKRRTYYRTSLSLAAVLLCPSTTPEFLSRRKRGTAMWSQEDEWEEAETPVQSTSSASCTGSSRSHYSLEPESCPWVQHAEMVGTSFGEVKVTVCGETSRPALVTYHDLGLNHSTCFQGLLLCEETASLLLQNFCIFHVDAPGHESEARESNGEEPYLSAEDLADQVAEVASHYGLTDLTCLGVTAGAYVMTLLATRQPGLVKGLILVSPVCRAPSWSEWASVKVLMATLALCGMARSVKDYLLERYFCQDQHGYHGPGTDALLAFRRELDERDAESVLRYMSAMHQRKDLTKHLQGLQARVLVVVGAMSPFLEEAEHMAINLNPKTTKYLEVEACGSLVTEERPQAMQSALRSLFRHLLPALSPARGYRPPPDAWFYSTKSTPPSSRSSRSSSPVASPQSLEQTFFSDGRRGFVSRSPVTVAFEDLSLAPVQKRLRKIRTWKNRFERDEDSDGETPPVKVVAQAEQPSSHLEGCRKE